jgi:hypothetical protein
VSRKQTLAIAFINFAWDMIQFPLMDTADKDLDLETDSPRTAEPKVCFSVSWFVTSSQTD